MINRHLGRYLRASLADVHNPRFNLREIVKQMVLLEDHLVHPDKTCPDCIRKHLFSIEALAEEAVCLDTERTFRGGPEYLAFLSRRWMDLFNGKQISPRDLGDKVRKVRKMLVPMTQDPISRVALRYLSKG